jgi:hypothetical protein
MCSWLAWLQWTARGTERCATAHPSAREILELQDDHTGGTSMAETHSSIARRHEQQVGRDTSAASLFHILDRFADEMDRMFDQFGFGRAWNRQS